MENIVICAKCHKPSQNGLPLCGDCRASIKDFVELVKFLNGFTGSKEELLWIINAEISCRQTSIINQCKVECDYANGEIKFVPIEPSSSTVKTKPWLKERFEHVKEIINEIKKLRRAQNIAIQYYGVS